MLFSQFFGDFPLTYGGKKSIITTANGGIMEYFTVPHRVLMDSTWTPQLHEDSTRTPHGLHVDSNKLHVFFGWTSEDSTWTPHGLHMDSTRIPHGLYMDSTWTDSTWTL